jgi:Glycosyltransferase Family 4
MRVTEGGEEDRLALASVAHLPWGASLEARGGLNPAWILPDVPIRGHHGVMSGQGKVGAGNEEGNSATKITLPPKNYGGTESVLSHLIEEQVAQGHEVTLFAPGDARTSARLISFFPHALIEAGVPWQGPLKAYYHLYKAIEYVKGHDFDIVHTHLSSSADMYLFPLTAHLATPHVMTLHSPFPFDRVQSWTGDADDCYMEWASLVPLVVISEHVRAASTLPLNIVEVVHHGLPMTPCSQPRSNQQTSLCG